MKQEKTNSLVIIHNHLTQVSHDMRETKDSFFISIICYNISTHQNSLKFL